jgi:integrase
MLILVRQNELGNRTQLEYLLSPETSAIVATFYDSYRTKLELTPSPYLLPGMHGQVLHTQTLIFQMKRFVGEMLDKHFNPDQIRDIVTTIAFEEDPNVIEYVRATLGHRTDQMAREAAIEFLKRSDHAEYLQQLTQGALRVPAIIKIKARADV